MGIPGLLMNSPWIHAYSQTICPVNYDSPEQMIIGLKYVVDLMTIDRIFAK
jgi:hypothetical protein